MFLNSMAVEMLKGVDCQRNSLDSFLDTILRSTPQITPQHSLVHFQVYGQFVRGMHV